MRLVVSYSTEAGVSINSFGSGELITPIGWFDDFYGRLSKGLSASNSKYQNNILPCLGWQRTIAIVSFRFAHICVRHEMTKEDIEK